MTEDTVTGHGWTVSNIVSTLRELDLSPQPLEPEPDEDLRLVALADPASGLRFGCFYVPGAGDRMEALGMICMIPAAHASEDDAARIDRALPMAAAFLEAGDLWVYAEFNIAVRFTRAFFQTQVEFYLRDMRTALQMLASGAGMSLQAARLMRGIARRKGAQSPMIRALSNGGGRMGGRGRRPTPLSGDAASSVYAAAPKGHCPDCRGSGKGLFRPCRPCKGTGLVR